MFNEIINKLKDCTDAGRLSDFSARFDYIKRNADSGDVECALILSAFHTLSNVDSPEGRQAAYRYASIAADAGHSSGYFTMAGLLRMDGGKENERKAESFLREAIKHGHIEAHGELGAWLLERNENLQESCNLLSFAVSRNYYQYVHDLFRCYIKLGNDVAAFKTALFWVKKADFDPSAYFTLGNCYMKGVGTAANPRKAVDNYRRGCKSGDCRCMIMMAAAYYLGMGTGTNPARGLAMLQSAVTSICNQNAFSAVMEIYNNDTLQKCMPAEDFDAVTQSIVNRAEDAEFRSYILNYLQQHGDNSLPSPLARFGINI